MTHPALPPDFTESEIGIWLKTHSFTMTGPERIVAAVRSIDYVVDNRIPGDIVECGVWRGGSMMAMAYALLDHGQTERTLFLYDTFSGMPAPDDRDLRFDGAKAGDLLAATPRFDHVWGVSSLAEVQGNLESTGYPADKIRYVAGRVEETLPHTAPTSIAVLRLDTDWYASTRHELRHLYPLLTEHGILIVDDYGHWRGSREATDEFFSHTTPRPFLHRIDYTGRLAVKPSA